MYPSGDWQGYWEQGIWGRQPMTPFHLNFSDGQVSGDGRDVVGRFVMTGQYDESTGKIHLIKQYIGKHQVFYVGTPDGEGCVHGTWHIGQDHSGPFTIRPVIQKARGDEPIIVIG